MRIKWKQENLSKWVLDADNDVLAIIEEEDKAEDGRSKFTVTVEDEAGVYISINGIKGISKSKGIAEKHLKNMVRDYRKEVKKLSKVIDKVLGK